MVVAQGKVQTCSLIEGAPHSSFSGPAMDKPPRATVSPVRKVTGSSCDGFSTCVIFKEKRRAAGQRRFGVGVTEQHGESSRRARVQDGALGGSWLTARHACAFEC